jgi:hypothetical protein
VALSLILPGLDQALQLIGIISELRLLRLTRLDVSTWAVAAAWDARAARVCRGGVPVARSYDSQGNREPSSRHD